MSGPQQLATDKVVHDLSLKGLYHPSPLTVAHTGVLSQASAKQYEENKQGAVVEKSAESAIAGQPVDGKVHLESSSPGDVNTSQAQRRPWRDLINPLKRKVIPPVPFHREQSREYRAGFLSALTFTWIQPLLAIGYQRALEANDIWQVSPDRAVDGLATKFKACVAKRRSQPRSKLDPLLLAIIDAFYIDFVVGGATCLCAGCLQILTPFVLKYLIRYVQQAFNARSGGAKPNVGNGIGLVLGIAAMQLLQSICTNQYFYRGMLLGGQARSVLISCIFDKALNLSARSKTDDGSDSKGWNNARINNLMSTDSARIDNACVTFHRCWVAPIQVAVALTLLCINLSYSALVGFALIVCAMPLLSRAIKALMVRRKLINKITDQRVHLTQETFTAIRMVKFFAWEPKLLERLSGLRRAETRRISTLLAIRNAILATAIVLPIIASMLTFITYSLTNHTLDPAPIFSSLALFSALGTPLEILPVAVGRLVDALASVKRLLHFFDAEEIEDTITWNSEQLAAISIGDGEFTWEGASATKSTIHDDVGQNAGFHNPFKIVDINVSIGRKEFVAVIGEVGSGKSSLLAALAGEMRKTQGVLTLGASRAFCAQQPWIQNATVRENILFGQELDEERYHTILRACALQRDIELLSHGDATEIGERGVTLSGGQKQRVNLARACYYNADVVLLDDPLSAVDTHVGKHIFEEVICGLLRDKCCVLATHQLHTIHRADTIIWMRNGRIHRAAAYSELINDEEVQAMMGDAGQRTDKPAEHISEKSDQQAVVATNVRRGTASIMDGAHAAKALMQEEERNTGKVKPAVYADFIRASGTMWNLLLIVLTLSIAQGANIVTSLWLSWWTSDRYNSLQTPQYIGVYAALGVFQAILMFVFATTLTSLSSIASRNMLNNAVSHTIAAPMSFFDTTPTGRLMNRFSKDADTMDNRLQDDLRFLLFIVATILSVFALIVAHYYYFIAAIVPLTLTFVYAASYYRASAREIKRYEAILRSHVFARFGEAISGTTTIRVYAAQELFRQRISSSLDSMAGAYYLTFAGQRWLSVRLDAVGILLILTLGVLIVTSRFRVSPGIAGLVLSYMLSTIQLIQQIVHVYANVQNEMNSVERLHHYGHKLEQEGIQSSVGTKVRPTWPEHGAVQFVNVDLAYRSGLPLALRSLTFSIQASERIGVVGRTGAGKSSLITAIYRLVELSAGQILVDGIDISTVPLQTLRQKLSIIPQDPVLFKGTVRSNLDPFDDYEDLILWDALRKAGLLDDPHKPDVDGAQHRRSLTLDSAVDDEGQNFSLGQRQLLALARVLIRKTPITIFDEATSSVDSKTDAKVQSVILETFRGRTLICIAHRLNTIPGYDRILVLDHGIVKEFDSPSKLFDAGGVFYQMCSSSGISREDVVHQQHAQAGIHEVH